MNWDPLLPLLTLLSSLVPSVIIFLMRETAHRTRTVINLTGATLKLGLIGVMLWGVFREHRHEFRFPVLPNIDLVLRADSLAMFFVTLSGLLWFLTTIYAITYLEGSPHRSRFFGFFSLCVSATVGIALAGNLFTFVVFYELLTLATYPLVVHRETDEARRAGRVYLAHTLGGGGLLLLGAAWLHVFIPSVGFDGGAGLAAVDAQHKGSLQIIFVLLIAGLGVKAALVPLHSWLPQAMVAPAPVSALLHAVAVVKAGAFGIMRVVYDVYGIELARALELTLPLGLVAAATILYGSLRALVQDDLKRRLAFSTVSQVSYITLGVALGGPLSTVGGVVHLVHQGLMKVTLFFCAGNLAEMLGIHKVSQMQGVGRRMPWTMVSFTLAALGMIGVPPLAGFISKWYLDAGAIEESQYWVMIIFAASTALNAAYFLPILRVTWFGAPRSERMKKSSAEEKSQGRMSPIAFPHANKTAYRHRVKTPRGLLVPPVVTAVLSVMVGLFAGVAFSPLQWATLVVDRAYGRAGSLPGGAEDVAALFSLEGFLLLVVIFAPIALTGLLISRRYRQMVVWLASFAALPGAGLAFFGDVGVTIDVSGMLLHMHLGMDATGQMFLRFTALLWLVAGIFARSYLARDPRAHHFFGWFLLTMGGNLGLVLSLDMVSYYFFFALMSFSAYGLIVHRRDHDAFLAGRVYIVLVVLGEMMLFAGMVLATMARRSLLFDQGTADLVLSPTFHWTFGLLLAGFAIKAGVLPLHVWLPLAHPAAPTPASAVLSGTMIKAGLLGWIRFLPVGEATFPGWGELCLVIGGVTSIYAAVVGVTQSNAKAVLAYSSISQMGLMMFALGGGLLVPAAWPVIAPAMLIYAFHHGLSKGCLFLSVGVAENATGASWRGRLMQLGLVIPALAMAGAPLTLGAVGKSELKYALASLPDQWKIPVAILLPTVAIGTSLLMARFLYLVWPRGRGDAPHLSLAGRAAWGALVLSVLMAAWLVPSASNGTGANLMAKTVAWSNVWPLILGVGIAWGGWQLWRVHPGRRVPAIPSGDLLILWQRAADSVEVGLRWLALRMQRIRCIIPSQPVRWVDRAFWRAVAQNAEGFMVRSPWFGVALLIALAAGLFLAETPSGLLK